MPLPILPLLIGGAALAFLVKQSSDAQGGSGGGSAILPSAELDKTIACDVGMPPATCNAVQVALRLETNPAQLRAFADSIPQFPIASTALRLKATAIESLTGVPSSVPPNVPAPPPTITPTFDPSQVIPPLPPVIVPALPSLPVNPSLPPAPSIPAPEAPQAPAAPAEGGALFDPGNVPASLPGIPASGATNTKAHKDLQTALANFFAETDKRRVLYPDNGQVLDSGFSMLDDRDNTFSFPFSGADGVWGKRSQLGLWLAQRWLNANRGAGLKEDGLPGTGSANALKEWFD
jgi:hypothetical protein